MIRTCRATFLLTLFLFACHPRTKDSRQQQPLPIDAEVRSPLECEAALTPASASGARAWTKTCDADGRRLLTCWAGHRAVIATCARCTLDGNLPRCDAPEVDVSAVLERELPAGLARCPGRLPYTVRLRIEGEGKSWLIDTVTKTPTVTSEIGGTDEKVDATLLISRAHLVDLLTDSAWDGMKMFFAGRMRIEGDQRAGIDASAWLSLPRSKERCAPDAGE